MTLVIVPVMYSVFDALGIRLGRAFKEAPATAVTSGNGTVAGFEPTPVAG